MRGTALRYGSEFTILSGTYEISNTTFRSNLTWQTKENKNPRRQITSIVHGWRHRLMQKYMQKTSGKNGRRLSPSVVFPVSSEWTPWSGDTKTQKNRPWAFDIRRTVHRDIFL